MNVVILQGNLTHEPLLKYIDASKGRVAVCKFSLAINRFFKNANNEKSKQTVFVDCEAWDSSAEIISKYVKKGDSLLVRGSLRSDTWEQDGQKRSKIKVRIEEFNLAPLPRKNGSVTEEVLETDTTESLIEKTNTSTPRDQHDGDDIPF